MINILIVFAVGLALLLIAVLADYIEQNRSGYVGTLCDLASWFTVIPGAIITIVALVCFVVKMLLGAF